MGASAVLVAGVTVGVVQTLDAPPAVLKTDTALANGAFAPAGRSLHTSPTTSPTAKPAARVRPKAGASAKEWRAYHRWLRHHHKPRPTAPSTTAPASTAPTSTAPTSTAPSSTAPTSTAPSSTAPASTAPASTAPASSAPSTSAPTSDGSFAAQVVSLTNAERAKAGCGALTSNATLTAVALAHSKDMAAKGYFAHESQDGTSPFQRMTAAGYSLRTAGENIAAGQTTPASVVTAWMNSSGHRANILNCSFTQIGVGYAAGGSYRHYWTQDFGTPR